VTPVGQKLHTVRLNSILNEAFMETLFKYIQSK